MLIDILFVAISYFAAHLGFQQGLIRAAINLAGWMFALVFAVRLTQWGTDVLNTLFNTDLIITPIAAFAILFFGFMKAMSALAKALEGFLSITHISIFNKIMGSTLYAFLFLLLFSMVLRVVDKYDYLGDNQKATSRTYYQFLARYPEVAETVGRFLLPFGVEAWDRFHDTMERVDSTLKETVPPEHIHQFSPVQQPVAAPDTATRPRLIEQLAPDKYSTRPMARPRKYQNPQ
jgi:uncharacterized membrane protein required for colicin V production